MWPHVEVLYGLGDVELVHGGDDDGRGGEEEEEDEEDDVDDQAAQPPDEAADGEVLPGKTGEAVTSGTRHPIGPWWHQELPAIHPTHCHIPLLTSRCSGGRGRRTRSS